MGCDIHVWTLHGERKIDWSTGRDLGWQEYEATEARPDQSPLHRPHPSQIGQRIYRSELEGFHLDRNYRMFGLLGNSGRGDLSMVVPDRGRPSFSFEEYKPGLPTVGIRTAHPYGEGWQLIGWEHRSGFDAAEMGMDFDEWAKSTERWESFIRTPDEVAYLNPDLHGFNCITAAEYQLALTAFRTAPDREWPLDAGYIAVGGMLTALAHEGLNPWLLLAFDN